MELIDTARELLTQLQLQQERLVLAESCTAGRIASALGGVPGVSDRFCGSAVVYREQTKLEWLGMGSATLDEHTAVSAETTAEIARCVLKRTPEATISLGITGHLGPDAPGPLDGSIFLSVWARDGGQFRQLAGTRQRLTQTTRLDRQTEAAKNALQFLLDCLGEIHAGR